MIYLKFYNAIMLIGNRNKLNLLIEIMSNSELKKEFLT